MDVPRDPLEAAAVSLHASLACEQCQGLSDLKSGTRDFDLSFVCTLTALTRVLCVGLLAASEDATWRKHGTCQLCWR